MILRRKLNAEWSSKGCGNGGSEVPTHGLDRRRHEANSVSARRGSLDDMIRIRCTASILQRPDADLQRLNMCLVQNSDPCSHRPLSAAMSTLR